MAKITQTQKNRQDHWLLGGNPRAIENQEAEGQKELIESCALPARINSPSSRLIARIAYERMGIRIDESKTLEANDPLFLYVILPASWQIKETNHSMWNHLLDDNGHIRAMIFYKAAFYDRDAFTNLICRYQFTTEFVSTEANSNYDQYAIVKDNATGERLFQSEAVDMHTEKGKEFRQQAKDFLEKNFPNHADFTAYW